MKKSTVHIHEAGHAAAALFFNTRFKSVDIIPSDEKIKGALGAVRECETLTASEIQTKGLHPMMEIKLKRDCIISMSGLVSEAKFNNKRYAMRLHHILGNGKHDLSEMFKLLNVAICNDGHVVDAYAKYIAAETVFLFDSNPLLWQSVLNISAALLDKKELTYKQCKAIYSKVMES